MKFLKTKAIALILSVVIISILFLIGPVQSLITGFTITNPFPELGQETVFMVSAVVETGEVLDIKNFTLNLTGPTEYSCVFDTNGTLLTACPGVSISVISIPEFNYGYGFSPGTLKYNVTLNTGVLSVGTYHTMLIVTLPDSQIKTIQQELTVVSDGVKIDRCSIRADSGESSLDEEEFSTRNSLSLFVPSAGASKGQGTIQSGLGKSRISYKFDVTRATFVDASTILFDVEGDLRIGRDPETTETSKIAFRSDIMEVDIDGVRFDAKDMKVTLAKC